MALRDHVTPRIIVPLLDDNTVAVRGLNLDDIMGLLPGHLDHLSKIAELYAQHKQSVFSGRALHDFIISIAKDFPSLVSEVISVAADEPDARDVKLSTGLQLSVLTAIFKLTIEDAGGLGNLFAQLRAMGVNAMAAVAEQRAASNRQPPFNSSSGPGASK